MSKKQLVKQKFHIGCQKGDLAQFLLLPGDPDRVNKIAQVWDNYHQVAHQREFHSVTGKHKSIPISCLSTGAGAPSTAIAVEESARLGVQTFIRVGSTGSLSSKIKIGDFVINTGAMRLEGASKSYVKKEYPAMANYEVILALIEACEKFKFNYHLGITASVDSFYVGGGHSGFKGYNQSYFKNFLSDLMAAKVTNIEMEAATIFTIANLYGLRAGAICVVSDNFITKEFQKMSREKELAKVASEAVFILAQWDKLKKQKHKKYFFPSLE